MNANASDSINIRVNGEDRTCPAQTTLSQLIEDAGLAGSPCAAELNHKLVRKRDHAQTTLREGDRVELVTLVGGG